MTRKILLCLGGVLSVALIPFACSAPESELLAESVCGNGRIESPERCDGTDLGGDTCESLGRGSGVLGCTAACEFDTTGCASSSAICGNDVAEGAEDCDGRDLSGQTCETEGYDSGNLSCNASCHFDLSDCEGTGPECGDGVREGSEACDETDLNGQTCLDRGFESGQLACSASCAFDTSGCEGAGPECGNGQVEADEACDGNNLAGQSCESLGFDSGTLACSADCTVDSSDCESTMSECGNGMVEAGEECDGGDLDGQTCRSQGFDSGQLRCASGCQLDTSNCQGGGECGNGVSEPGEDCDGDDLAGEDCQSLGYQSGNLGCTDACDFDESDCSDTGPGPNCGNGDVNFNEDCDGDDLDGEDCESLGFESGDLACSANCTFDTSSCVESPGVECGDGVAEGNEECDTDDFRDDSCEARGFAGGELSCDEDCVVDDSECIEPAECDHSVGDATGQIFDDNLNGEGNDFELNCDGDNDVSGPDLSFEWTAPASGCFKFITAAGNNNYDTVISVFENCSLSSQLDCDDDGGEGLLSYLELDVEEGQSYAVVVDSYDARQGDLQLIINPCTPEEWTCDEDFYGNDDGCDCGCGVLDPDCESADSSDCEYCAEDGSCNDNCSPSTSQACCRAISNDENWLCD